jgi:hypothetical protein
MTEDEMIAAQQKDYERRHGPIEEVVEITGGDHAAIDAQVEELNALWGAMPNAQKGAIFDELDEQDRRETGDPLRGPTVQGADGNSIHGGQEGKGQQGGPREGSSGTVSAQEQAGREHAERAAELQDGVRRARAALDKATNDFNDRGQALFDENEGSTAPGLFSEDTRQNEQGDFARIAAPLRAKLKAAQDALEAHEAGKDEFVERRTKEIDAQTRTDSTPEEGGQVAPSKPEAPKGVGTDLDADASALNDFTPDEDPAPFQRPHDGQKKQEYTGKPSTDKILKALRELKPNLKVFIHETAEAYHNAIRNLRGTFAQVDMRPFEQVLAEAPKTLQEVADRMGMPVEQAAQLWASMPNSVLPEEAQRMILSWNVVGKSPYSDSYYSTDEKSWTHTPHGVYRISDHWNFRSRGAEHAQTTEHVQDGPFRLAQYDANTGKWTPQRSWAKAEQVYDTGEVLDATQKEFLARKEKEVADTLTLKPGDRVIVRYPANEHISLVGEVVGSETKAVLGPGYKVRVLRGNHHEGATGSTVFIAQRRVGKTVFTGTGAEDVKAQYDHVVSEHTLRDGRRSSKWRKGPAGDTSKLNERQWVTVRTQAFKQWFGNWELSQGQIKREREQERKRLELAAGPTQQVLGGSGVQGQVGAILPEAGGAAVPGSAGRAWRLDLQTFEPKTWFHGTHETIGAFEVGHASSKDHGWLGQGVYLTDDPRVASEYAKLKARTKAGGEGANVMPLFSAVQNPYFATLDEKDRIREEGPEASRKFTEDLKRKGYDGVVLAYPEGGYEMVAFAPWQVKSATGNVGSFLPHVNDINEQRNGVVASSWGVYDPSGDGAIHVNPNAPNVANTLFHEASHPIIAALAHSRPDLFQKFYNEAIKADGGKYERFGDLYKDKGPQVQQEEAIVQYVADILSAIANKEIPVSTRKDSLYQRVKEFIQDILAALGWDTRSIDLSKPDNVREMAGQIAKALEKGIKITGLSPSTSPVAMFAKEMGISVAEAQRQYDAVVAQYTNKDGSRKEGWMKNPNGTQTPLTETQWAQTQTPAFKNYFGDWMPRAAATPGRKARTLTEAREAAQSFVGKRLRNGDGRTATVSGTTLGKMTSGSAVVNSTNVRDHALAVANADQLFANAVLDHSHADKHGEPTVKGIHRYVAPMVTESGEVVAVKLTVKETTSEKQPNPLYTIETIEIGNPPSMLSRANPDGTGIRSQAGFSAKVNQLLAAAKGEDRAIAS